MYLRYLLLNFSISLITIRKKRVGRGGVIVQNSYILLDVLPLLLVSDLINFLTLLVIKSCLKALVYLE